MIKSFIDAGWSSLVARRAHNPKVVGSNPAPATITKVMSVNAKAQLFINTGEGSSFKSCPRYHYYKM